MELHEVSNPILMRNDLSGADDDELETHMGLLWMFVILFWNF